MLLLAAVVGFVTNNRITGHNIRPALAISSNKDAATNPLDTLSSADIAVEVARLTSLDEATAVTNKADSVNAELSLGNSGSESIISKPLVIGTSTKSKKDIRNYVTKDGDTVSSLAARFGVTSDSIRWSNNLSGDKLIAGKDLVIPPVTGIVYTVKTGDTPDSLAQRYRANKEQIIAFNDAEIGGLVVGERILIPDGNIVPAASRSFASSSGFSWGGNAPVYGSNGYDYGYCTWWVQVRRTQIGRAMPSNLGNAVSWKSLAPRAGLGTGNTPQIGAAIWTDPSTMSGSYYQSYGHVGFVEKINDDGSVWVSDMNSSGYISMDTNSGRGGGWGRTSYRLLTPAQARGFTYIY